MIPTPFQQCSCDSSNWSSEMGDSCWEGKERGGVYLPACRCLFWDNYPRVYTRFLPQGLLPLLQAAKPLAIQSRGVWKKIGDPETLEVSHRCESFWRTIWTLSPPTVRGCFPGLVRPLFKAMHTSQHVNSSCLYRVKKFQLAIQFITIYFGR